MATYGEDLPSYKYFDDSVPRHMAESTSFHEAGHAILGAEAGIEMEEIRVMLSFGPGRHDIGSAGYVALDAPNDPSKVPVEKLPGWLIAVSGGQVAQAMWYERYKPGWDFDRAMAEIANGACHDEGLFKRFAGRRPPMTWPEAQARARQLIEPRWMWVEQLSRTLFRTGESHGRKVADHR